MLDVLLSVYIAFEVQSTQPSELKFLLRYNFVEKENNTPIGFSVRLMPGVRISASTRGIRAGLGLRVARVNAGSGGMDATLRNEGADPR